ncbi:MAG: hypothetical protein KJ995_03070 [Candidatus Omnitrophica bacterium]|nr:hypothetical protein [Candidatus Omnitrophota bacterium]
MDRKSEKEMFGSPIKNKFKFFYAALACAFLVSMIPPSYAEVVDMSQGFPPFQKGMCYVTWEKDGFASPYSEKALKVLREMGVEYLQINVTQYQDRYNSTTIKATPLTPTDSSVKYTIETAHKLGMKTMLKPHLDLINNEDGSYWRADIGFHNDADWKKWFAEYEKFIVHYAKLAEKNNVEVLCVGTELSFASQKTAEWKSVISLVKRSYSGKLIYAANWDNYKNIGFWEDLDYIGIDAYFPLTYNEDPDLSDIKEGWKKWIQEIESWVSTQSKAIVFTEIGYASSPGAPSEPWKNGTQGNADVDIQAKCYIAFFEAVWDRPWLAGVYWWKWGPSVYGGGKNNRRFTPMNKPAAEILTKHYVSRMTKSEKHTEGAMRKEIAQKNKMLGLKMKHREQGSYGMAEEKSLPKEKE